MNKKKSSPDFIIFFVVLSLLSIGIIMVLSSSSYYALLTHDNPYYYLQRQLFNASIGLALMVFAMVMNYRFLNKNAGLIFSASIALLVAVLLTGQSSGGAGRWLNIGGVIFQPSEIVKIALIIFMARRLSINQEKIKDFKAGLLPNLIILAVVFFLILAQPDLGTAVAIALIVYFLFIAAGARIMHLFFLAAFGVALVLAAIIAEPYRLKRFYAYLNPYEDPIGAGFQTIQSMLALGSGGLFGMGLGNSGQKFLYIPERHTDFIYAILGEEFGFIGAVFILMLFVIFAQRGFKVAINAPDQFSSLLAAGITIMISVQAMLNIGVVIGVFPVTGITLPFISYGGSSLIFTLASVGVLLNISRYANIK